MTNNIDNYLMLTRNENIPTLHINSYQVSVRYILRFGEYEVLRYIQLNLYKN